jgi:signal transduction histidine kinase
MNKQDLELRKRRAEEARWQKAKEIGSYLAERLNGIEQSLLRELSSDPSINQKVTSTYPEMVFLGRIIGEELQMPWEGAHKQLALTRSDRSRNLIHQAQQAEFSTNNPRGAVNLYNQALSHTASRSQKIFIQLQIGRILSKSGDDEGTQKLYEEILNHPGDMTDEYGIPFALYAADRLIIISERIEPILDRIEELMGEMKWLPPSAFYLIRDITVQLLDRTQNTMNLDRVQNLEHTVENSLLTLDRIQSLRGIVTTWNSRRQSSSRIDESTTWEPFGDIPWIVGIRDGLEDETQYLFTYHGPDSLSATIRESGLAETYPGSCQLVTASDAGGISLGRSFRDLRIQFEDTSVSAWSTSSLPLPILYWLILILVVGFAGFGMYLLWRDFSRELAIAEMRSHFAASVSHELKTPLTAIRMFAEALTMGVQKEPDAQMEYLQTIISESERLSRLLNNVLDFSKIEQGTRTYRFERISLEDVIQAAAKAMTFPLEQKGFNIKIEVEKGIPQVRADKDALEQAILNLLHNALKYSGDSREIVLKLRRRNETACIDVLDHGIGISEENRDKIFGKFFRVSGPEDQKIPGTGLGLTIVSHIVEAHGGRVEVSSRPGEGSTFSILIPLEAE